MVSQSGIMIVIYRSQPKGGLKKINAEERIICALDVHEVAEARRLVEQLDGRVSFFKVGMLLYLTGGMQFVQWLLKRGLKVFLDLKLYDVPDTIGRPCARLPRRGADATCTQPEILQRVVCGCRNRVNVLAVTVLTT